ncbi:hypothetical protein D7U91_01680 [Stenotrophomonas maltophilia]|nr:hypothetical protein [Stenotrophomonas maltophilia]MBA0391933.1 hypothetical protein [Stenotrophomonas maltophilia]MBA0464377.1 hypothetical protein [Stenotrophomonas maltophilia]MBA0471755.1 hypothetical protein [Stenotrophomonas maltophilia]
MEHTFAGLLLELNAAISEKGIGLETDAIGRLRRQLHCIVVRADGGPRQRIFSNNAIHLKLCADAGVVGDAFIKRLRVSCGMT